MEPQETIDGLFTTFLATGDPGTLGQVFDATCDDLYRLALHLCGAPSTAEDVVQATWLAAIEGAGGFAPGRPVKPWLTGILHNQARMHFRREAVRRRPLERGEEPFSDPAAEAERRELIEALDQGIAQLAEPYGPVVRLHLRHGLNANAIGEALDRPAGTVRTQLVRGLDRLRGLLPASLAGVAAALALPSRGMAAVRSTVMTKAGAGSTAVAVSWWSLRNLAVAAAVLVAGVMLWRPWAGAAGVDAPIVAPATAAQPNDAGAIAQASGSPERQPVAPATGPAGERAATVSIRGLVVDEAGAPIAAAEVLAFEYEPTRIDGGFTRETLARARSAPDGSFEVALRPGRFHLHATADGLALFESVGGATRDRELLEGFEIRMQRAATVRGLVVDPTGRPVADQVVELSHSYGIGEHVRTAYPGVVRTGAGRAELRTDADGRFAVTGPEDTAFWWTVTSKRFARWQESHELVDGAELTIHLERGDSLAGRVFLADGRPAQGAAIWLHGYPPREATADAAGWFELKGATLEEKTFLTVTHPDAAVFCLQPIPALHDDLTLQLEQTRAIRGRVVDGGGAPVVDAVVRVVGPREIDPPAHHGVPHTWEWANDAADTRTDADGSFAFERLFDGEFEVQAAFEDLSVGAVAQTAMAGRHDVLVQLTDAAVRKAVLVGTVVAAEDGRALGGAELKIVPGGGGRIRQTTADADGHFELVGFEPGTYHVTASVPGRARTELPAELVLGETELRVEVAPAIDVTLRILDGRAEPIEGAWIGLRRSNGADVFFQIVDNGVNRLRTDEGGEVALRDVPREPVDLIIDRVGEDVVVRPLDLRVESGLRIDVLLDAVEEPVQLMVVVAGTEQDVGQLDPSTRAGVMALRGMLTDGRLFAPSGGVRATLSIDGGRELATAVVTPTGWDEVHEPEQYAQERAMGAQPYSVSVTWPGGGSESSASPMPLPSFHLPGRAVRMRLRVAAEGFEPSELVIDGAPLVDTPPRPRFVVLRRL